VNVVVRFPDGSREYRYPAEALEEGGLIWHDSKPYRIVRVETDDQDNAVVTVELDSDELGDLLGSERGAIQLVPVD
jgi:hypothetical protein